MYYINVNNIIISIFSADAKQSLLYDGDYGDVNGDNKINIMDATAIQYYIAGTSYRFKPDNPIYTIGDNLADFNGDYEVDIRDVTDIQKMLAKLNYNYNHPHCFTKGKTPDDAVELDTSCTSTNDFHNSVSYTIAGIVGGRGLSIKIINSRQEYKNLFEKCKGIFSITDKEFETSAYGDYDDAFFKEKSLLYLSLKATEDPFDEFAFKSAFIKDNTLYLKLRINYSLCVKDIPFMYNRQIPIEKNILKNIDEICVDADIERIGDDYLNYFN